MPDDETITPWHRRPYRGLSLGRVTQADKERQLARLDRLLFNRARNLRGSDDGSGDERPVRRDGFTLVELLVVISVILILVALTIGHLGSSMRRAGIEAAAAEILAANDTARQLALQANGIGEAVYGVRIADEKGAAPYVAVIVRDSRGVRLVAGADGEPLHRYAFPSAAVLWKGVADLRTDSEPIVEWYFGNGSGKVRQEDGSALSSYPVSVGTAQYRIDGTWGDAANSGWSPVICPDEAGEPGLSVRSSDRRYGIAIRVHPNGIAFRERLDRATASGTSAVAAVTQP